MSQRDTKDTWLAAIDAKAERWDAAMLALNACDAVAEMDERED